MGNYENGTNTRQAIVQACKHLFYEKGYHETSYSDICKAAHVNRGTIYYHFKDKEFMRYEVMWEYTIACKRIAEKYCARPEYHYILGMYLQWHLVKTDANMRRFLLSTCIDYPVYTGKRDFSHYYSALTDKMWGSFFDRKQISELAFASVYGYIMSFMRMMCEHPGKYDPLEMFEHCVNSSISIWGFSQDKMEKFWCDIKHYIALIPEEEIRLQL